MILVFGGIKGGTGKSTVATNCAAALCRSTRVVLVDATTDGATSGWMHARKDVGAPECALVCARDAEPAEFYSRLCELGDDYDEVIVDAESGDTPMLRAAMLAADVLLSPLRPSQADLWAAESLDRLVSRAHQLGAVVDARIVLSLAPTHHQVQEARQARAFLGTGARPVSGVVLCARKAYRDAFGRGLGVIELEEPGRAGLEIQRLIKETYGRRISSVPARAA